MLFGHVYITQSTPFLQGDKIKCIHISEILGFKYRRVLGPWPSVATAQKPSSGTDAGRREMEEVTGYSKKVLSGETKSIHHEQSSPLCKSFLQGTGAGGLLYPRPEETAHFLRTKAWL